MGSNPEKEGDVFMKKYNIFLVDADNTILDFHASSEAALKSAFESFGEKWKEEYGKNFTRFNDSLWERLERKEITRERLLEERFPLWLEQLGKEKISGKEFNARYIDYLSKHPIYMSGAEDFLRKLKSAGKVYIVTNGTYFVQKSRFDIAKLWDYIEDAFVSEKSAVISPERHIPIMSYRIFRISINRGRYGLEIASLRILRLQTMRESRVYG